MQLSTLPEELILKIFTYLDLEDLCRISTTSATLRILSLDTTLWSRSLFFPSMNGRKPSSRACHIAEVYEDYMYIYGGHVPNKGATEIREIKDNMYRYSFQTGTWELIASDLPEKTELGSVVMDHRMYLIGGYAGKNGYCMDIIVYDFKSGKFFIEESSGHRPMKRSGHTVIEYKSNIYIFGGWDGQRTNNDFFKYNTEKKTWKKVKKKGGKKPTARRSHCAVSYGNKMYVFGGWDGDVFAEPELHSFDFVKKKWKVEKTRGREPSERSRAKMVVYHNKLAVIGGWNRQKHFNDWYEFNVEAKRWAKRKDVRFPSSGGFGQHSLVVKGNRIYFFGGYDEKEKKATNNFWGHFLGFPNAS